MSIKNFYFFVSPLCKRIKDSMSNIIYFKKYIIFYIFESILLRQIGHFLACGLVLFCNAFAQVIHKHICRQGIMIVSIFSLKQTTQSLFVSSTLLIINK